MVDWRKQRRKEKDNREMSGVEEREGEGRWRKGRKGKKGKGRKEG